MCLGFLSGREASFARDTRASAEMPRLQDHKNRKKLKDRKKLKLCTSQMPMLALVWLRIDSLKLGFLLPFFSRLCWL
jgi:hypothetical protein